MRKILVLATFAFLVLSTIGVAVAGECGCGGGCKCGPQRSDATQAVLAIRWKECTRVSPANEPVGEGRGSMRYEPVAPAKADRPMWVYVTATPDADESRSVETVVLANERIAIGSWAFRCLKISSEDAAKDPLLANQGRDVPRFVFVSRDWKVESVIDGDKRTIKGVWREMQARVRATYAEDLEKRVKDVQTVLVEWDAIARERDALDKEVDGIATPTAAQTADFEKRSAALDARDEAATARTDVLLKFQVKES